MSNIKIKQEEINLIKKYFATEVLVLENLSKEDYEKTIKAFNIATNSKENIKELTKDMIEVNDVFHKTMANYMVNLFVNNRKANGYAFEVLGNNLHRGIIDEKEKVFEMTKWIFSNIPENKKESEKVITSYASAIVRYMHIYLKTTDLIELYDFWMNLHKEKKSNDLKEYTVYIISELMNLAVNENDDFMSYYIKKMRSGEIDGDIISAFYKKRSNRKEWQDLRFNSEVAYWDNLTGVFKTNNKNEDGDLVWFSELDLCAYINHNIRFNHPAQYEDLILSSNTWKHYEKEAEVKEYFKNEIAIDIIRDPFDNNELKENKVDFLRYLLKNSEYTNEERIMKVLINALKTSRAENKESFFIKIINIIQDFHPSFVDKNKKIIQQEKVTKYFEDVPEIRSSTKRLLTFFMNQDKKHYETVKANRNKEIRVESKVKEEKVQPVLRLEAIDILSEKEEYLEALKIVNEISSKKENLLEMMDKMDEMGVFRKKSDNQYYVLKDMVDTQLNQMAGLYVMQKSINIEEDTIETFKRLLNLVNSIEVKITYEMKEHLQRRQKINNEIINQLHEDVKEEVAVRKAVLK